MLLYKNNMISMKTPYGEVTKTKFGTASVFSQTLDSLVSRRLALPPSTRARRRMWYLTQIHLLAIDASSHPKIAGAACENSFRICNSRNPFLFLSNMAYGCVCTNNWIPSSVVVWLQHAQCRGRCPSLSFTLMDGGYSISKYIMLSIFDA